MNSPVVINPDMLNPETLEGLVDSFILREGTDYGSQEKSLESKREQLLKQISHGDIYIVFEQSSESVTILTKQQLRKLQGL